MSDNSLPSETFCILPWIHLSSRPDGKMRTCCTSNASSVQDPDSNKKVGGGEVGVVKNDDGIPANFNHTSLEDAWNSDYMRNVRKMMMRGEKPASCLKCYKEEDAGHRSKRNWETEKWAKKYNPDDLIASTADDGSVDPKLRYIDLRMGTKCQLACVMCSPHDSSGWIKEWQKLYPSLENEKLIHTSAWENKGQVHGASYNWHKNNPRFWEELMQQVPHMDQLYFAGGESLIIDEHYDLLEQCIEQGYAKNIELRYNSNAVEWRDDLFDLWKEFKHVIFQFSIDEKDDRLHYIRYPATWEHLESQIRKVDDYPHGNLTLKTAYTVMALNIYHYPDFVRWKLENNLKLLNAWPEGSGIPDCHLAYWPPQLNVKSLPKDFKEIVTKKYEEFYPWLEENWHLTGAPSKEAFVGSPYGIKRLQGLVSFMNSEDWSQRLPEMAEWCYKVAKQRDLDFDKIFPEMIWLKEYL